MIYEVQWESTKHVTHNILSIFLEIKKSTEKKMDYRSHNFSLVHETLWNFQNR